MADKTSSSTFMDVQIGEFLRKLGLNDEECLIYLTLARTGILTILELSRKTNINRTRVYRLLDRLTVIGLVEEVIDEHRKMAKAAGVDKLKMLVKEEEEKTEFLNNNLPNISLFLSGVHTISHPGTKVLFYRGKEGIKRQVWNTLRTENELCGYSFRPLKELIGDYYLTWYEEWTSRKFLMRDIYSDEYLKNRDAKIIDSFSRPTRYIKSRYIPSNILSINHQIDIYNDVVSLYSWFEGEIFGVEIYNEKVAAMQKQLFEIVWKMALTKIPNKLKVSHHQSNTLHITQTAHY